MNRVFLIIKLLLFVISTYGYIRFLINRTDIKIEFAPVVVFSCQGMVLFMAGILNFMREAVVLIFVAGIVLAAYSIFKREKLNVLLSVGIMFFCAISAYFLVIFNGQKFVAYDDFSHWATVVKTIIINNRLPNFLDSVIVFQSYPPGAACFIYYLCKTVTSTESIMMFAQSILIFSGLISIFGAVKKNKIVGFGITSAFVIFALSYGLLINRLTVDLILVALGIASVVIANEYRDNIKKVVLFVTPILCFLMTIKNSGIYFVAFTLLFILLVTKPRKLAEFKYIAISFIAPIMTILIWQKHVKLVYVSGLISKHSMSRYNLSQIFLSKSDKDLSMIVDTFIKRQLEFNLISYIFIALLVLILTVGLMKTKLYISKKCIFISMFIGYLVYQMSLLAMYVYSMPTNESLILAGYERYYRTIVIFIFGLLVYYLVDIINHLDFKKSLYKQILYAALVIVIFATLLYKSEMNFNNFKQQDNSSSIRYKLDDLVETYNISSGKSYIIFHNQYDYGYAQYIAQYTFMSKKIRSVVYTNEDSLITWEKYDYLIILEDNASLVNDLNEKFPTYKGQKVIKLSEFK